MMAARVCSNCPANWPVENSRTFCPVCSRQTCLDPNAEPISKEDAERLITEVRWKRYWNQWTPEKADPKVREEALKEVEARVAMWREFEELYEEAA